MQSSPYSAMSTGHRDGHVDWSYAGAADIATGTGATSLEKSLGTGAGLCGATFFLLLALIGPYRWTWWGILLGCVLAFDLVGGVVANTLNACKRFYHTAPKGDESAIVRVLKNHAFFAAVHVHPLIIAALYPAPSTAGKWLFGVVWYVYLQVGVATVLRVPLYIARAVAFCFATAAIFINLYFVPPVPGFEWFAPVIVLKIVYGHAVQEEPYRPLES